MTGQRPRRFPSPARPERGDGDSTQARDGRLRTQGVRRRRGNPQNGTTNAACRSGGASAIRTAWESVSADGAGVSVPRRGPSSYRTPLPRVETGGVPVARLIQATVTAEHRRARREAPGRAVAFNVSGRSEFASRTIVSVLALTRPRYESAADFGPPTGSDQRQRLVRPAFLAGFRLETPTRPRGRPAPGTVTSTSCLVTWSGRTAGIKPAG